MEEDSGEGRQGGGSEMGLYTRPPPYTVNLSLPTVELRISSLPGHGFPQGTLSCIVRSL